MSDYLATAVEIVRRAAATLREGHERTGPVDFKGEVDLVTEWDRRSEGLIVEALQAAYPDHAIHAEEGGGNNHPSDYQWIVDPLDGTTNFAHGLPVFAVSIALLHRGRPLVGVVADVLREEYYTAEAGGGAALNGRPIHVSKTASLAVSLLGTGFPYDLRSDSGEILEQFANFAVRSQAVRRIGSAALDLVWTAAGRFDGYWEFRLKPWDVAAGALIAAEAGATVTDAGGGDDYLSGESIVASNGLIHAAMLRVLREGRQAPLPGDNGS